MIARGARPLAVALATLTSGCVYGARGGVESLAYSQGSVLTHATATGLVGLGSTSRAGMNQAFVETLTLGVGGDLLRGGGALTGLAGLEYFSIPERGSPQGFRFAIEAGARARWPDRARGELLGQLRGGPVFRVVERRGYGEALFSLGIEAIVGFAVSIDRVEPDPASFVGGVAITFSGLRIRPFHL